MPDDPETRAFVALVDTHGAGLWSFLRTLCRREQDAEDLFQEVAARVWRKRDSLPALRNPRGWLMTVAYHVFLDQAAGQPRTEEFTEAPDTREISPPEVAVSKEEAGCVRKAVTELADPLRELVTLHYSGGLTIQETAVATGVAAGTIKSRLHAALNQLRRRLS